jgi:putative ABC transport system ATP-binding protein
MALSPIVSSHDLHRRYGEGDTAVDALRGVTIDFAEGRFTAIMGPSGSGKSTLMNVIGLLDRADAGTYRFEGTDVAALSSDDLALLRNERVGFVFQAFHLLPRTTAIENVELPLIYSARRETQGLGMRALERVGLGDRARHFPNELSGGQQQRVAIARALVLAPDVILADEPTGNLDSGSSREIMEILRTLNASGTTVVVVTHDLDVARYAKRTVSMVDGLIQADTTAHLAVHMSDHPVPAATGPDRENEAP